LEDNKYIESDVDLEGSFLQKENYLIFKKWWRIGRGLILRIGSG